MGPVVTSGPSTEDILNVSISHPAHSPWAVVLSIRTRVDLAEALDKVLAAMTAWRYPSGDTFAVRLALEEALVNALKHGHGYDPDRTVRLRCRVGADEVLAEVEDEGPGFDHTQVADPLTEANRERPSGRGLLLIRHYTTWARYNDRGNHLTLCKARSNGRK